MILICFTVSCIWDLYQQLVKFSAGSTWPSGDVLGLNPAEVYARHVYSLTQEAEATSQHD